MKLIHNENVIRFNPLKVKFKNGESSKLERIEYIFFDLVELDDDNKYMHFCLGFDNRGSISHPTTFFIEESSIYIQNQECKNVISLYIKSEHDFEFRIYWHNVRTSMKKNSHYKWLARKGAKYGFNIDNLKKEDLESLEVESDDELNEIKRHFELLRLDEIKVIYQPYIPDAIKWNNEQKRFLVDYIDKLEDKNVLPDQIKQKLKTFVLD